MLDKKALPSPFPSWAPFTKPAISTTLRNAGTLLKQEKNMNHNHFFITCTIQAYQLRHVRIRLILQCFFLWNIWRNSALFLTFWNTHFPQEIFKSPTVLWKKTNQGSHFKFYSNRRTICLSFRCFDVFCCKVFNNINLQHHFRQYHLFAAIPNFVFPCTDFSQLIGSDALPTFSQLIGSDPSPQIKKNKHYYYLPSKYLINGLACFLIKNNRYAVGL